MDRMPVKLPLAIVTLCLPMLLLLVRVGPGPLAAPGRQGPAAALPSGPPAPTPLAEAAAYPVLAANAPVQVFEMEPITIVASVANVSSVANGAPPASSERPRTGGVRGGQGRRDPGSDRARRSDRRRRGGGVQLVGTINVNTATAAQLEMLPGMGPKRAAAVIRLRTRRPLRRAREVVRVRGIGPATWRRWKANLTVSGPTSLGLAAAVNLPHSSPDPASRAMASDARGDPR